MSTFDILMPKMGESVEEATITKWFVKVGDTVEEDQVLLEIATDKVDSEIPSPVAGVIKEIKFETDALVPVGEVVAVIAMDGEDAGDESAEAEAKPAEERKAPAAEPAAAAPADSSADFKDSDRFYSPLVKSIAKEEQISVAELDGIKGSGKDGRVTKEDVLDYLKNRGSQPAAKAAPAAKAEAPKAAEKPAFKAPEVKAGANDDIVEMDRMRKLIADNMLMSKQVSPHVTSIGELFPVFFKEGIFLLIAPQHQIGHVGLNNRSYVGRNLLRHQHVVGNQLAHAVHFNNVVVGSGLNFRRLKGRFFGGFWYFDLGGRSSFGCGLTATILQVIEHVFFGNASVLA